MAKRSISTRSGASRYEAVNLAYKRRVRRLLNDEDYGPKLVRLSAQDQQTVLRLVYRNQGREARRAVIELDAARRGRRTVAERARRYAALPSADRSAQWRDVRDRAHSDDQDAQFWELYRHNILGSTR